MYTIMYIYEKTCRKKAEEEYKRKEDIRNKKEIEERRNLSISLEPVPQDARKLNVGRHSMLHQTMIVV